MSRKRKKKVILNVVAIMILLVLSLLVWELGKVFQGYVRSQREYEQLQDIAVLPQLPPESGSTEKPMETGAVIEEHTKEDIPVCPITVDFEALWQTNDEIIGWIYMECLDLSYPIVQAQDNDKYLHTSVNGTANSAGAIFVDAWNHADFGDPHTIVYGHNMRNGTMFGSLKKLRKQQTVDPLIEEAGGALTFWILTPEAQYRYEIFSIHAVDAVGDVYALFSQADKQFAEFVNKMAKESEITLPQRTYDETDRMVTLSTCTGNDAYRLVVQGIRTKQ